MHKETQCVHHGGLPDTATGVLAHVFAAQGCRVVGTDIAENQTAEHEFMKSTIPKDFALLFNRPIRTQRLLLEPLVAAHADILFNSLCDERIYRWIESGGPKDLSELRSKWQRNEARLSPDGNEAWLNWAIRLEKEGPYIGKMDAELDSPINVTNVGFVLFPKYWGYGYATEALLGVNTALAAHGITRMRATVSTPNTASARVLEKAGFTRGQLVTDEIDTHEYTITIPQDLNTAAQQSRIDVIQEGGTR